MKAQYVYLYGLLTLFLMTLSLLLLYKRLSAPGYLTFSFYLFSGVYAPGYLTFSFYLFSGVMLLAALMDFREFNSKIPGESECQNFDALAWGSTRK